MIRHDGSYVPLNAGDDTCENCDGAGTVERTLGGDGYGDRCCGQFDAPVQCAVCGGVGRNDLALQLDVELALDKLTIDHGKVVTGYHDLVALLEEERRIELEGAAELAALLGVMVRE